VIRVTSLDFATAQGAAQHYVLAGQPVVFDTKVEALRSFYVGPATQQFSELLTFNEPTRLTEDNAELKYAGQAPFCNQLRNVQYWRAGARAQLNVDGRAICHIDFNELHIHLLNADSFDAGINLEVIVGPAMVLLLAGLETYCLHAGAVATRAGNVAIIGESGAGKSTLSAHVDNVWLQLSDDILPTIVAPSSDAESPISAQLLLRYPQLKLDAATPSIHSAPVQPLDFLLRINPVAGAVKEMVVLDRRSAMLQIVRHTVGAKLFDASTMKNHARFAKKLSKSIPMYEISYPRDQGQLADLQKWIVEQLSQYSSRVSPHE